MCSTQVGDGSRSVTSTPVLNCLLRSRLVAFAFRITGSKGVSWQHQCEVGRIRDPACSVLQGVALRWAPGTVLWALMICFLTLQCILCSFLEVLWDISWLSICSVELGEAVPWTCGERGWEFHGMDHVSGTDGLSLGMFSGSDSITDDVFQENVHHL